MAGKNSVAHNANPAKIITEKCKWTKRIFIKKVIRLKKLKKGVHPTLIAKGGSRKPSTATA
jgi:hypothetical protein